MNKALESFMHSGAVRILETWKSFFYFLQEKDNFKPLCFKQPWWGFKLSLTSILNSLVIKQKGGWLNSHVSAFTDYEKAKHHTYLNIYYRELVCESFFFNIFML